MELPASDSKHDELARIVDSYERRSEKDQSGCYSMLQPHRCRAQQEKERSYLTFLSRFHPDGIMNLRVLEVGCGCGDNLLWFLRWGFSSCNLVGCDLLPDHCKIARTRLPQELTVYSGDAAALDLPPASFDIVLQSTVFSSILNDEFAQSLAARMWDLAKPRGGILWYDLAFDNPGNVDVKGVPLRRIKELFPAGRVSFRRITLAPPIARRLPTRMSWMYDVLNSVPLLRSHLFCWIEKLP